MRRTLTRCRLQRPEDDGRVRRVSRYDGPVVERLRAEGLTLGGGCENRTEGRYRVSRVETAKSATGQLTSKIRFETSRVEHGNQSLDRVERRTSLWRVLRDVSSSSCEDGEDGGDTICRGLDLDGVHGLHQTRRGLERKRERHLSEQVG